MQYHELTVSNSQQAAVITCRSSIYYPWRRAFEESSVYICEAVSEDSAGRGNEQLSICGQLSCSRHD